MLINLLLHWYSFLYRVKCSQKDSKYNEVELAIELKCSKKTYSVYHYKQIERTDFPRWFCRKYDPTLDWNRFAALGSDSFCSFFFLTTKFLQLLQATMEQLWWLFFEILDFSEIFVDPIIIRHRCDKSCRATVRKSLGICCTNKNDIFQKSEKARFFNKRHIGSTYHHSRIKKKLLCLKVGVVFVYSLFRHLYESLQR